MHRRAEFGIAAHWGYKEERDASRRTSADDLVWLQRLVDWQQETDDPAEFMQSLKIDLEQDEVFVFTPKGKVVTMPTGANPVDFAYAIHTEVGHRCIGARVNGRLVPLDSTLASGDTVEIFTSKVEGAGPSRDWLQFATTPRARSKIRHWFSRERRVDAIDTGRDELVKALRKESLPIQTASTNRLAEIAETLHYADVDALHAAIGEGHVSGKAVAQRLRREMAGGEEQLPITARRPARSNARRRSAGVHVEGLDDVLVRLSRCCTPGAGRRDHRVRHPGSRRLGPPLRLRERRRPRRPGRAAHRGRVGPRRAGDLRGVARGRGPGPLPAPPRRGQHARRPPREHPGCTSQTSTDRVARFRFDFELADPGHLESIIAAIKRVDSIYEVSRVLPGHAKV